MMRWIETIVGSAIVVAIVACMHDPRFHRGESNASAAPAAACPTPLPRAPMLCNRVTADGSAECAICAGARGCMSSTHVYCANSCDDPACVARAGK